MASSLPSCPVNRECQVIEKATSKNKIEILKDLKTGNARQLLYSFIIHICYNFDYTKSCIHEYFTQYFML